jgi:hypothetical protein
MIRGMAEDKQAEAIRALARAVQAVAHGEKSGPTGLEALAIAVGGEHYEGPLGPAIQAGLADVAGAIREGLADIAQAIREAGTT